MSTLATLLVKLGIDADGYNKGLDGAADKTDAFAGKVGGVLKGALAAGALLAAGAAVVKVVGSVTQSLSEMAAAASEAEGIQAQLGAVLKSTNGAAGVSADEINNMATSLSYVTKFEDDAIVSGQSLLLTFTNIGQDIFPQATETMLDMSQALGQDMKSSAMQLGKALNDPIEGVSALRRVGVSFTDSQEKMIKSLVESGRGMEAQKIILKELQTEFGGAAKAAGETFSGQLTILGNQIGNAKELIGQGLIDGLAPLLTMFAPQLMLFIDTAANEIYGLLKTMDGLPAFFSGLGTAMEASGVTEKLTAMFDLERFDLTTIIGSIAQWFVRAAIEVGAFADNVSVAFDAITTVLNIFVIYQAQAIQLLVNQWTAYADGIKRTAMSIDKAMRYDFIGAFKDAQAAVMNFEESTLASNNFYDFAITRGTQVGKEITGTITDMNTKLAETNALYEKQRLAILSIPLRPVANDPFAPDIGDQAWLDKQAAAAAASGKAAGTARNAWVSAGGDIANAMSKAFDALKSKIDGGVSQAQSALDGLLKGTSLENTTGGNAPGQNGWAENIFRAADVAVNGDKSQWAEKLGLDQKTAIEVVTKFKQGLIDEQVKAVIGQEGIDKLIAGAQLAVAAEKLKSKFVEEIAKKAGVGANVVSGLMGITTDEKGATTVAEVDAATSTLLDATGKALGNKTGDIEKLGTDFMGSLGKGIEKAESTLVKTVEGIAAAMLDAMRKALNVTIGAPPTPGSSIPPNKSPDVASAGDMRGGITINQQLPAGTSTEVREAARRGAEQGLRAALAAGGWAA